MDEDYRHALIEHVKPRFHGKETIQSRASWNRPDAAERDYKRLTREIDDLMTDALREALPKIKTILDRRYEDAHRYDSQESDLDELKQIFDRVLKRISTTHVMEHIEHEVIGIQLNVEKMTLNEWKKAVKRTIGIDLFTDYYRGEKYKKLIDQWIQENVDLISKFPAKSVDAMQKAVFDGWYQSKPTRTIIKEMQEQFGMDRRRAEFIAVDQTSKLHAQITKCQQTEAGVEEYIWSTCLDHSVRSRHRELHGQRFRWDDPPLVDAKNNRHCHPGEDYRCRCVALPVFNVETLDIASHDADWNAIDERYRQRQKQWIQEKRDRKKARKSAAHAKKK